VGFYHLVGVFGVSAPQVQPQGEKTYTKLPDSRGGFRLVAHLLVWSELPAYGANECTHLFRLIVTNIGQLVKSKTIKQKLFEFFQTAFAFCSGKIKEGFCCFFGRELLFLQINYLIM